ncbi:MAG: OmpA family protein [Muribaculaceae bacterium]|nr:OmpA family protein [Muribaculaceae bacterium]
MKKSTFLALVCALFIGQSVMAQDAKEITYVEDPSQGYLFNKFSDNWFVTAEGGAGVYLSPNDSGRDFLDRWSPAASVYVGKWFSPIIGLRLGVNWLQTKGLANVSDPTGAPGIEWDENTIDGEYKQKFNHVGPVFDVMLNLTNWWCGYKPGRIYNCIFYAGAGDYWTFAKKYEQVSANVFDKDGWEEINDRVLTFRAGLINSFNVSKQVQLSLDLRFSGIDNHVDEDGLRWNKTSYDLQAYLGVTYLFKKREWNAPIVPVCPEPENCDAILARLQAADAKIAELEQQLKACLERPVEKEIIEEKAPLATIYYPINVSKLTRKDINVLTAVAEVMKDNPDQKYVLTGWADNYTGNDQINTRLRKNRAAGVEKQLIKCGVPASQLETTINHNNLVDLGEKYQALGRAVTIEEAE